METPKGNCKPVKATFAHLLRPSRRDGGTDGQTLIRRAISLTSQSKCPFRPRRHYRARRDGRRLNRGRTRDREDEGAPRSVITGPFHNVRRGCESERERNPFRYNRSYCRIDVGENLSGTYSSILDRHCTYGRMDACLIRAPLNSVIPFAFALAHFVFHFHSIFTPLPSLRRPRPLPALPRVPTRRPPGGSEGRRTTGRTRKFRCHF